jgi:mono/diheme cytochrome c family protein
MSYRIQFAGLIAAMLTASTAAAQDAKSAAERGALAVRGHPAMNPALWSLRAYDNVWKQWGLTEKPAEFPRLVRERYGLHPAPYENGGLPMGLHVSQGLLGKGIINDCLLCHAGRVAGQTVIGVGNSAIDLQGMFDDFAASENLPFKVPVPVSYMRGTVDPVNPVGFLMEFRDLDLNVTFQKKLKIEFTKDILSDPPAWWLLKRKETRNWTGGVRVNSIRVDMVNLLTPLNSLDHIKKHESTFADIHAFVLSVPSPKYPFAVDERLAEQGRGLFMENCAKCHGSAGAKAKYPNKVVPLDTLGTDPTLALSLTRNNMEIFNKTWFSQEKDSDGSWYKVDETPGFQAPPLDGIWATAPYFHNASVPTVYHVLNSKARPRIFTRSYRSEKDDYDTERLGVKFTTLDAGPDPNLPGPERRKIYDSTRPGHSNAGHTFGDHLTDDERRAVIEYLKTL